jgi:putative Ca2+/H+ antiporter (TMEM165/GDT1 family)
MATDLRYTATSAMAASTGVSPQTGALRLVAELAPPNVRDWWNWALFVVLAWAAVVCATRRFPVFDTALLVVGAAFSLRMQRDIWFGSLAAGAVLTRLSLPAGPPADRRLALRLVAVTAAAVILARGVWTLGPAKEKPAADVNRQRYPAAAVEYVRAHRLPGPLYNHFDWGGYLIWALPDYPVGLDGRTNLYGEERLERAARTWAGADGWDRDPDLLAAGVIIAPRRLWDADVPLTVRLRAATDRWQVAYEDDLAAVFVPNR